MARDYELKKKYQKQKRAEKSYINAKMKFLCLRYDFLEYKHKHKNMSGEELWELERLKIELSAIKKTSFE